jgi:hypothetical protein
MNMPTKKPQPKRPDEPQSRDSKKREQEAELEQALEDTFPSSDPVSVTQPTIVSKKKRPR